MTRQGAIEWVNSYSDDDELDKGELTEAFKALYGRVPDDEDRDIGLWSLVCAASSSPDES